MSINDQIEFWNMFRLVVRDVLGDKVYAPNGEVDPQVAAADGEFYELIELKRDLGEAREIPKLMVDGLVIGEPYSCGVCQEQVKWPHRCPGYLYW